jgi:nifR3 family TIM-barrel protein
MGEHEHGRPATFRFGGFQPVGENRTMPAMTLGSLRVETPVVLAPMAGITNAAYRRLCAEQGAGLYVCEMITSRGLVEGDETTRQMLVFDEAEQVRSVQLYGTDPVYVGKAVEILCSEYGVAHVDLNFGCPVPKVTRKGGGGALPWKRGLLGQILEHAVTAAAPYDVPVTMKTRTGLDEDHLTYLDAGRVAQETGCAAIALHGRTVAQAYSGTADWDAIAALVEHVDIPVLGNGDIWEAADAVRMVEQTGATGVVVGRGCLGRPWLFRDLAAAFAGEEVQVLPSLGEVRRMMRRHAELLSEHMGEERGCKEFRKHVSWYLKGFRAGGPLRHSLALVDSLAALDALLDELDPNEPFPVSELGAPRGRQGSARRKVVLPEGWLDDQDGAEYLLREDTAEVTGG